MNLYQPIKWKMMLEFLPYPISFSLFKEWSSCFSIGKRHRWGKIKKIARSTIQVIEDIERIHKVLYISHFSYLFQMRRTNFHDSKPKQQNQTVKGRVREEGVTPIQLLKLSLRFVNHVCAFAKQKTLWWWWREWFKFNLPWTLWISILMTCAILHFVAHWLTRIEKKKIQNSKFKKKKIQKKIQLFTFWGFQKADPTFDHTSLSRRLSNSFNSWFETK